MKELVSERECVLVIVRERELVRELVNERVSE